MSHGKERGKTLVIVVEFYDGWERSRLLCPISVLYSYIFDSTGVFISDLFFTKISIY